MIGKNTALQIALAYQEIERGEKLLVDVRQCIAEREETNVEELEQTARAIAAEMGRDWSDCGAYERQSFYDAAGSRLDDDGSEDRDEYPDCVWRHAATPFAANH